ncbi:LuxR C-terminal-related transcriptional regulator [Streptomyces poonensis]|uniref:Transcriptional regulator n=1 Tax=Streptomyces poonensis TaxID=68255 RepID=A0A918PD62_9ACTN|nr:LuxR C-terminal-related transcriptional regulator [Streptomyces poonensis]GGY99291.1 transcriptional regulator [Streptomyces poonensis]
MADPRSFGPEASIPSADPRGDPFLSTRFSLPARPDTFLRRDRLVAHLDRGLSVPLTLINGSAGAGKTLLAADWAAGLRQPVAWLTADGTDEAPGVFWAYVLEALRTAGIRVSEDVGRPAHPGSVDHALLARLAADLGGRARPAVLVVDEFERVPSAEIAEQLQFVLHHAARGMRLVLVTRTEPLLPLHRYRAAGSIAEIRGAELAFTPGEAATLLDSHGLSLTGDAARALVERTRGWAAGLRLCALAAQQSSDPETYLKEFEAGQSTVADFLLAEVLKRQPAQAQDLLLRVSVVERFRPGLADALTGRTDGEPIISRLHRENAFVEHLGRSWYRLHPLFAEILRTHLRERRPGLERELHRRAARWLSRCGSLPETLAHGAAAGDWEFTARTLVDDLAIGQLLSGLRTEALGRPFARLAPETAGPAASIVLAARELCRRDLRRGLTHLQHAQRQLDADTTDDPGLAPARLSCALLEVLAARLAGSPLRAEQAAKTAGELQGLIPAERLDRHPELTALLLTHLGSALVWAGRFDEARSALSRAVRCSGSPSTTLPRQDALGHLALIDYLNGWPGQAEKKVLTAMGEAQRLGLPPPLRTGIGRLVLAAVAVDRDELDEAQALLEETAPHGGAPDPVEAAGRIVATSRLLLARGQVRDALRTVRTSVPAEVVSPWVEEHAALVASAGHLAEGRPEAAVEVLGHTPARRPARAVAAAHARLAAGAGGEALGILDALTGADRGGPALTVRATLVRAQAADQAGDLTTARRLATQALLDARRERLRRPFLEAGPWLRRVLGTGAGLPPAWDLLAVRPPGPPTPGNRTAVRHQALVVEQLSERERDVLQRLAQMMSTDEIAADLYVSVNTVKTHLKSVFRKLGVNRRSDAVRRARELRLL